MSSRGRVISTVLDLASLFTTKVLGAKIQIMKRPAAGGSYTPLHIIIISED